MYRCDRCGAMFDEPESEEICYEDENGVSSLFNDRHYGSYAICPDCGSDELIEFFCDEDCGFCYEYEQCTLEIRKEIVDDEE